MTFHGAFYSPKERTHAADGDQLEGADHVTPDQEMEIFTLRKRAAELECEAAATRLQTAQAESQSAKRTLKIADRVAQAMLAREGIKLPN